MKSSAPVVAEDEDYLYLHKCSGVPVFAPHHRPGPSLEAALLQSRPPQARPLDGERWPEGFAAGIVHRLDGWTSGLVIAARSLAALGRARELFSERALVKHYFFLSARSVDWQEHLVEHALAHDRRKRSKMVWQRGSSTPHRGRWYPAKTALSFLGAVNYTSTTASGTPDVASGPASAASGTAGAVDRSLGLWGATMSSGVMHQIRVHAAAVGVPLLGDRLYGGAPDPGGDGRFYLHHSGVEAWPSAAIPRLSVPADWPASRSFY